MADEDPLLNMENRLDEALAKAPNVETRISIALGSITSAEAGNFANSLSVKDGPGKAEYAKRYREISDHATQRLIDALAEFIDQRVAQALKKDTDSGEPTS